jgi:hypothetical protein
MRWVRDLVIAFILAELLCVGIAHADRNAPPFIALPSAARTVTVTSEITSDYPSAFIIVDVTSLTPSEILAVGIQMYDPVTDDWVTLTSFPTLITGVSTEMYFVGSPNMIEFPTGNRVWSPLPREWRILITHVIGDGATYSVGVLPVGGF